MSDRTTPPRDVSRRRQPRLPNDAKEKAAAAARARCTEIAMLAAAKGWGKKKT